MAENQDTVNWLFLAEIIVVAIVASAFLFYWNRLFASVFTFLVRVITWRRYNAYISIGSLQLSTLAGRISFRDVEYHSSNMSVRALHGHITWRYWKLRVRQEEDSPKNDRLPCRINVFAKGVEAFVYNRTPAYDAIVERMKKHEGRGSSGSSSPPAQKGTRLRQSGTQTPDERSSSDSYPPKPSNPVGTGHDLPYQPKPVTEETTGISWFREALPFELKVETGSIVLGSDATPMVVINDFRSAQGIVEVTDSRSTCDHYKLSFGMNFKNVKLLMRTNPDYSGSILAHGKKVYDELLRRKPDIADQPPSTLSIAAGFRLLARQFQFIYSPKFSTPPLPGLPTDRPWKGLARYRDSSAPPNAKKTDLEYAKVTTLLDSPSVDFRYYADTPGPVPASDFVDPSDEIGNIDPPPEYGMDVVIHGGMVKYGPWADRQRDALQRAFAPSIFFDSEPRPRLQAGETRIHTNLTVNVELAEDTTLRIPTREPSKDWLYDSQSIDMERRYGWLDVNIGANSSFVCTQAQIATEHGYDAMLALHLDSLAIASSVNLETFIKAKTCKLSVTMPTPLRWDARRNWGLDVTLDKPDITLLRDHVTLISDLSRDWSSGAVGDFHHFVPNDYSFRISLINFDIHLNVNDYNIVDRPKSRDDNAFVDISGPRMDAYVAVAAVHYRPEFSVVPFTIHMSRPKVHMCVPKWDTHRSSDEALEVGKVGDLTARGSYRYYASPKPDHQEHLTLHLDANNVVFKALGWVIRRMFAVKDNYFGGFTQFTTMQEYLERFDHAPGSVGDPVEEKYRPGRSDSFGCQITMDIRESLLLMSDAIYSCERGLVMPVPQLQMALKSVEQYMELSLDAPPTYTIASDDLHQSYAAGTAPEIPRDTDVIFVEGIELKANRLFGPQPRATTYLCLWEMSISTVSAFLSPALVATLQGVKTAFGYNFSDVDNAPASMFIPKTPPDVTFFKMSIKSVVARYAGTGHCALVELPGLILDTSSLAGRTYGSMIGIVLPSLLIRLVRPDHSNVGVLTLGVAADIFNAPSGWHDKASAQQAFMKQQDAATLRVPYMYSHTDPLDANDTLGPHLPRPGAESVDSLDIESTAFEDEAENTSSSDEDYQPIMFIGQGKRRQVVHRKSFATAKDTMSESDTSTVSSYESTILREPLPSMQSRPQLILVADESTIDLAEALLSRLRHFRPLANREDVNFLPAQGGKMPLSDTGKIIRVSFGDISCEVFPESIQAVIDISESAAAYNRRPEVVVDSLLDKHADEVLDHSVPTSLFLDISIPAVHLQLPSKTLALDIKMRQTHLSLAQNPLAKAEERDSSTSVQIEVTTDLQIVGGGAGETTLGDATSSDGLLRSSIDGLRVSSSRNPRRLLVNASINHCDTHFVTSLIPSISKLIPIWIKSVDRPASASWPDPGSVIYSILKVAIASNSTHQQPPFSHESAYGLHVDDARNIRRDLGWMQLARLHHWLHLLKGSIKIASTLEMANYVIRELAKMEYGQVDEDLVRKQFYLSEAFSSLRRGDDGKSQSKDLAVTFQKVLLSHHGRALETDTIVSSVIAVDAASFGLIVARANHHRGVVAVSSVDVDLKNSAFALLQSLSQVTFSQASSTSTTRQQANEANDVTATVVFDTHFQNASISLLAGGIKLRASSKETAIAGTIRKSVKTKFIATLAMQSGQTTILQPAEDAERTIVAASVEGLRTMVNSGLKDVKQLKVITGLERFELDSRPQLRAFYEFGQEWRKTQYGYYEPFIAQITGRLGSAPDSESAPTAQHALDLTVGSGKIQIRAAKELWLRWDIGKVFLSYQRLSSGIQFGAHVAPQTVGAYTSPKRTRSRNSSSLRLPSIRATGTHRSMSDRAVVSAKVDLGFFTGILKPAILDRLLSLHHRLGSDFMEVVEDYRAGLQSATGQSQPSAPTALFDIQLSVEGVRFGLRADDVTTTLLFEALALDGHASNRSTVGAALQWRAKIDHLGLSLGHLGSIPLSSDSEPMRKSRSAYMVLDIDVKEAPGENASQLTVSLNRVHTVMHVAALSELADLLRSWSDDISDLNDNRAAEVAEVKMQTSKVLKKLEPDVQVEPSWFASRLLTVEVTGFGIAIPLTEGAIDTAKSVPALLYSIRVISFSNRKNETARFRVSQMALQFLDEFDQGIVEHFTGDFHPSSNRMSLPSVDAKAQMLTTQEKWCFSAHCSATDFKLSLTPDVTDGIFCLMDLYEKGRASLAEFERQYNAEMAKRDEHHVEPSPTKRQKQKIFVQMSFTFNSGIVELHRPLSDAERRSRPSDTRGRMGRLGWHDTFHLPTISIWMDHGEGQTDADPALLVFNAAVHESRNVLGPSILPFFVEIVKRINRRVKDTPSPSERQDSPLPPPKGKVDAVALTQHSLPATGSSGRIRLQVTLRIDRSELRLSCAPDSDAYVDLKWESGGFLGSTLLGGEDVTTLAGTVSGVTAYLSHEFAEQGRSCIEAGARDMSFSLALCSSGGEAKRGLSIVVDTQISAQFRLEAFSAWLIFSAVWLDNAPKFDVPIRTGLAEAAAPPTQQAKLSTVALIRFRSVDFDTHIAVTKAKLEMTPILVRTLSNGEKTEVEVSIGTTQVTAEGDISGDIRSDSLTFNTIRRSRRASPTTDPTVLEMAIEGGHLRGNLFLGDINIVRFHLEPSKVTLSDDWRAFTLDPSSQVSLAFAVKAGHFQGVLRLLHIPRLLGNAYSIFDMVDSQNKIATQRSEAFKTRQSGRVQKPALVSVMLQTSSRSTAQIRTAQTMRFDLSGIDVGIFNEDLDETAAFYRFLVGKVEADLKRQLKHGLPGRDLSLLVTYVRWETSDGRRARAGEKRDMTARDLINMASRGGQEVASLPLMTLTMGSAQLPDPPTLEYDFTLIWGETDGDVAIWPNFFEQAFKAFQNLIKGLDEQQLARARRLGPIKNPSKDNKDSTPQVVDQLVYRPRQGVHAGALPVPRLKILGEGTGDAAKLVPKLNSLVRELPSMSHRFVTLTLEEGMDLLLKLYEKQLPDRL